MKKPNRLHSPVDPLKTLGRADKATIPIDDAVTIQYGHRPHIRLVETIKRSHKRRVGAHRMAARIQKGDGVPVMPFNQHKAFSTKPQRICPTVMCIS